MRTRSWLGLGLAALLVVLSGAAVREVQRALSPARPGDPEAFFTVSPGESLPTIARNLERAGLVRSGRILEWLARYRGLAGRLQAGEYRLSGSLSGAEILERIAAGRVATYEFGFPEGFTLEQIARRLGESGLADPEAFLAAARDPATASALGVEGETLEGYLFPETYHLPRGLEPRELARIMVDQFLRVWREIEPLAAQRGLSMREVVTLASIIEKETGAPEERPLIASVFLNRLARRMRLETDPTVIYGIPDFDGNLRRSDLENAENPYNTYRIFGLPPGPIASPGGDALRAAVSPAETDYLYFVSRNDGTHVFSRTYGEHASAVDRYQRRGGR